MVKLSGPDCFQLPRLGFLMWSRDEGAVVALEGEHHSGEWKDECRPGSFCCCFVVVLFFFFWNTPHVEFQISKSPVQTPHFQPQTSNSKLPLSSVHIKKLQTSNSEFQIPECKCAAANPQLGFIKLQIQSIEILNLKQNL